MLKNKIIKLLLASIIITSTAYATPTDFYFKAQAGQTNLQNVKNFNSNIQRSNMATYISASVGVDIDETTRLETQIEQSKVDFHPHPSALSLNKIYINLQHITIHNMSLNLYKDIIKINDKANIFFGIGVGRSFITERVERLFIVSQGQDLKHIKSYNGYVARKSLYKFSYNFDIGGSYKINNHTNIEVSYRYKDYGSNKKTIASEKKASRQGYKGHIITTGFRYNF